jgi:hypothetical protein
MPEWERELAEDFDRERGYDKSLSEQSETARRLAAGAPVIRVNHPRTAADRDFMREMRRMQAEEMDRPINWERISLAAFAAAGWTATFVLVLTR